VSIGERYVQAAVHAGDPTRLVTFPGAGHFEIASPFAATWPTVESEIVSLLAKRP
jgi:hypothetical protein